MPVDTIESRIIISAVNQAGAALSSVQRDVRSVASTAESVTRGLKTVGAALIGGAISRGIGDMVGKWEDLNVAVDTTTNQIIRQGKTAEFSIGKISAFAEEVSARYLVSRTDIIKGQQIFMRMGIQSQAQMEKLTVAAIDLASATGQDLPDAMQDMARASLDASHAAKVLLSNNFKVEESERELLKVWDVRHDVGSAFNMLLQKMNKSIAGNRDETLKSRYESERMKFEFKELSIVLGKELGPAYNRVEMAIGDMLIGVREAAGSKEFKELKTAIGETAAAGGEVFAALGFKLPEDGWVGQLKTELVAVKTIAEGLTKAIVVARKLISDPGGTLVETFGTEEAQRLRAMATGVPPPPTALGTAAIGVLHQHQALSSGAAKGLGGGALSGEMFSPSPMAKVEQPPPLSALPNFSPSSPEMLPGWGAPENRGWMTQHLPKWLGGRQHGGPVSPGMALVGERGPELVRFHQSGIIMPAHQTQRYVQPYGGLSETTREATRSLREFSVEMDKLTRMLRETFSPLTFPGGVGGGTTFRQGIGPAPRAREGLVFGGAAFGSGAGRPIFRRGVGGLPSGGVAAGGAATAAGGGLSEPAFEKMFAGTPLAGQHAAVVAAANKQGIAPAMLAGIIAHETGRGGNVRGNNPGGLMDPASGWAKKQQFGTIGEGIEATARTVAKNFRKGGNSIEGMGKIYARPGAANDPRGLNAGWSAGVRKHMTALGSGEPVGPGGAPISGPVLAQVEKLAATGNVGAVKNFVQSQGYNVSDKWCGEFVSATVKASGGTPVKGGATASSWLRYGEHVAPADVRAGDVAVSRVGTYGGMRGVPLRPGQTGGHVGVVGSGGYDDKTGTFHFIGGNPAESSRGRRTAEQFEFRRPAPPPAPVVPKVPAAAPATPLRPFAFAPVAAPVVPVAAPIAAPQRPFAFEMLRNQSKTAEMLQSLRQQGPSPIDMLRERMSQPKIDLGKGEVGVTIRVDGSGQVTRADAKSEGQFSINVGRDNIGEQYARPGDPTMR